MRFSKMQGVGNDFVVVNSDTPGYDDNPERLAIRVCDRKFGIGADGLLIVTRLGAPGPVPPAIADRHDLVRHLADGSTAAFAMRMFNPDGTEDMCGNGLRCVGLWALKHGWLESPSFAVLTKEGLRSVRIISVEEGCQSATLGVDMGRPHFEPEKIPFAAQSTGSIREFPLTIGGRIFPITSVNTGSTHTVIFGPQPTEEDFQQYSPLIEEHSFFPERTSVLWSTVIEQTTDRPLQVITRIWERGAGETLGCGTGACAVAVAAQELCLARPGQVVQVKSRGGTLAIGWGGGDSPVDMVGPAVFTFEGELGRG
jgi:diaminopimelate epimerase